MAALGEGFVIPARVVVSVEGLNQVKAQLESFVAASKAAGGQRPVDPGTGAEVTVRKIQEETGAALNQARQAAQMVRQELGRSDVSKKRRQELEGELQVLKQLEAEATKYTRALRTTGGKVQPPIYPEGVPRYPSIAAQERGRRAAPLPEPEAFRWTPAMLPTQKWQQRNQAAQQAQWAAEAQTAGQERAAVALADVRKYQEEAGASLNKIRQAAQVVNQELGRGDVSAKRRKELEAELQVLKQLEASAIKYSRALRTPEGGKAQPPIYPEGTQRYPTVSAQAKGARAAPLPEPEGPFRFTPAMLPTQKWQQQNEAAQRAKWAAEAQEAARTRTAETAAATAWSRLEAAGQAAIAARARQALGTTAPESVVSVPLPRPRRQGKSQEEIDRESVAAKAEESVSNRLIKAQERRAEIDYMLSAKGREALTAEQNVITGRAQIKAVEEQIRAADREYLKATADSANAREDEANRIKLMRMGRDPGALSGEDLRIQTALVSRAAADREKAALTRRATEGERESIDAAAKLRVEERKLALAIRKREAEVVIEQRKSGEIGRGTFFQRLQTGLRPASGKLPEEQLTAKQFIGDKFERTLGYAVSGMALGAGMAGISEMFRDAMQLEQTFVRLRGQLEGIGRSDAFAGMREQIRGIAQETGVASNQIGVMYSRFLGISGDPAQAAATSAEAAKLMTVTGLDEKTTLESLVPIMKSFNVEAEQVGDQVVAMGEKFGISEDDLTTFLGKTAITAKQAGLSLEELTALGSNLANSLGKPISSSAESINKSFSLIENNAMKIVDVLRANPQTQGFIKQFSEQVGGGETGKALFTLMASFKNFTATQRQNLLTKVVSKREAEEFNALFENSQKIIEDAEQGSGQYAGRLNQRFEDLKNTVALTFQTVKASLEALGDLLFRAGVSDWAKDVGNALGIVVGSLSTLIAMFAKINEIPLLGGTVSTLGRIAATTFLLTKLYGLFTLAIKKTAAATNEETTSEVVNSAAKQKTVTTNQQLVASEGEVAAAREGAAAVPPPVGAGASRTAQAAGAIGGMPYAVSGGRVATKAAAAESAEFAAIAATQRHQISTMAAGRASSYRAAQAEALASKTRAAELQKVTTAEVNSGLTTRFMDQQAKKRAHWLAQPPGDYNAQRNLDRDTAAMRRRARSAEEAAALRRRVMDPRTAVSAEERSRFYQRELDQTLRRRNAAEIEKLRIARLPPPPSGAREIASLQQRTLREQVRDLNDTRRSRYLARRALASREFAQQAEEGTFQQAGFGQRAIAGGRVFRAPRADARLAATGQSALGSNKILVAALAVAGAAAIKSAYDEQQSEVKQAADDMKLRLKQLNVTELKQMGTLRTDLVTDVAMAMFDVAPPETARLTELAFAETTDARRALGAPTRPNLSNIESANKKVEADKAAVEDQMAERLGAKGRWDVLKDLLITTEGRQKAQELGLAEQIVMGGMAGALPMYKPVETNVAGFGKLIKEATTAEAGGATPPAWKSLINQRVFDKLKDSAPDLVARSKDLTTATSAIADLQKGNTSVDQWLVDYAKNQGTDQGNTMKLVDELNRDFESGRITQAEYLSELKRRLPDAEHMAAVAPGSTLGKQSAEVADQIRKQIIRVENITLEGGEGLRAQLKAMGSLTPKKVTAEALGARVLKQDVQEQYNALPQLIEADLAATEEMWGMIADPEERLAAMNQGAKFAAATREVFLKKSASSSVKADAAIKKIAGITGQDEGKLREQLARQAATEGRSLEAVATDYIDKQIAFYGSQKAHGNLQNAAETTRKYNELTAARNEFIGALAEVPDIPLEEPDENKRRVNTIQIRAVQRKLNREERSISLMGNSVAMAQMNAGEAWDSYRDALEQSEIFGSGVKKEDVQKAKIEAMKADRAVGDAEFSAAQRVRNRAVILAQGDPVKETAARLGIARQALAYARAHGNTDDAEAAAQEIMQLEQQVVENQLNIRRATMQKELAMIQEDPMQAALKQLQMAEFELANAKGDADREAKMGAVISARMNIQNSISNSLTADAQLAITLASLRNDPVEAARLNAVEAKRRLDEAIAKGIKDSAVLAPLEGALAEANRQAFLAPINKQIEDLDWLYGMQQIGLGDYVTGLEAQLSQLDVNSREYRDLALKIFNLKKGAQSELQWNLPGNLELPTLYEARRASQTNYNMGGGPYQDNRNISVAIAVNGTDNPVAVANQVVSALNDSLRGGNTYTANVPLSAGL